MTMSSTYQPDNDSPFDTAYQAFLDGKLLFGEYSSSMHDEFSQIARSKLSCPRYASDTDLQLFATYTAHWAIKQARAGM